VGESAPSDSGYDAANLAEDIHQLVTSLGLKHVYVFGHDIGGMVAYAFARLYPATACGAMIFDVAFPGLDPWQEILGHPAFWHVHFHQTDLPEKLVRGRQAEYFHYFLSNFSDDEVAHYAHAYRDPDHLRAAFETYRAFSTNAKFFAARRDRTSLSIVIGSGEHDAFAPFLSRIAAGMRAQGCVNLRVETIRGAAHYVAEEKPEAVEELIEHYAGVDALEPQ
jgi:pimeloyl-ACP methyl ester carboxylesterase